MVFHGDIKCVFNGELPGVSSNISSAPSITSIPSIATWTNSMRVYDYDYIMPFVLFVACRTILIGHGCSMKRVHLNFRNFSTKWTLPWCSWTLKSTLLVIKSNVKSPKIVFLITLNELFCSSRGFRSFLSHSASMCVKKTMKA